VLGSVAEIVRRQNEPYRDVEGAVNGHTAPGHTAPGHTAPGHTAPRPRAGAPSPGPPRPGPPLSSRIIKAANAFDDLVGSSLDPGRAAAAVQRLRLDTACEYDPAAVEALSRVVNRRSVLL
jgi:hypothetical protein